MIRVGRVGLVVQDDAPGGVEGHDLIGVATPAGRCCTPGQAVGDPDDVFDTGVAVQFAFDPLGGPTGSATLVGEESCGCARGAVAVGGAGHALGVSARQS